MRRPAEESIAHGPADNREIATGIGEGLREGCDDRVLREVTEAGESGGHIEHDSQGNGDAWGETPWGMSQFVRE
ncbi:hypothetical protein GCM10010922_17410 [Microbacterium sorbitolivorans]|nr:hypothetical protein GCM10010922_17410 [Microbacterium sorbitolivorans]